MVIDKDLASFYTHRNSVSPARFVEDAVFPSVWILGTFVQKQVTGIT